MKQRSIIALLFTMLFSVVISAVSGFNPLAVFGVVTALSFIAAPSPVGALFSGLDVSGLTTALGAYCREHRDILISETLLDESFAEKFEVMDDVQDELPLPNLSLIDLIKPEDAVNFTPTANAVKFGARVLKVRGIKVDLQLIPKVLEKTWLGKQKSSSDPFDMPFEQFIMNYISQKAKEELHLQGLFRGVYNAAGTTPIATMQGFLALIAAEITATNIVPVVTGAITADTVIDAVEETYDALGEAYKAMPTQMFANPTIFDWYNRKYRSLYGGNMNYTGMKRDRILIDGTNCELVREPGLGASQRLIASPKDNFVMGVDTLGNHNIDIQKFNRSIKILIDFKAGVQLKQIHSRALAVNDQA